MGRGGRQRFAAVVLLCVIEERSGENARPMVGLRLRRLGAQASPRLELRPGPALCVRARTRVRARGYVCVGFIPIVRLCARRRTAAKCNMWWDGSWIMDHGVRVRA
jgi:hypothetical protein